MNFEVVGWKQGHVTMLDQRLLPEKEIYNTYGSVEEVAGAIKDLVVRGAPAIGVAAAFGTALASHKWPDDMDGFTAGLQRDLRILNEARPTARNLLWALERQADMVRRMHGKPADEIRAALLREAEKIRDEDLESCMAMGRAGAKLVPEKACILTHCNAGALATAGYGTALGVVRGAVEQGKQVRVIADETRPFLQGARLTAWELMKDNIDVTVITDNMAGHLMAQGEVDLVVVGADRIAANGDVANKIGTYSVAVIAKYHDIPFYVAAPLSTFDFSLKNGSQIPIEERGADEITIVGGSRIAPEGVKTRYPAFDITPAGLISAIITEKGIVHNPCAESVADLGHCGA